MIWHFPQVFSELECKALVAAGEAWGFQPADVRTHKGPAMLTHIRNNERALGEHPTLSLQLNDLLIPQMGPVRASNHYRMYRYGAGQFFKMHRDGPTNEDGGDSKYTCLIYLNDAYFGGETTFKDLPSYPQNMGDVLVFEHSLWHQGSEVQTGVKYVARTDIFVP